jgi:hypothetical protein
MRVNFSIVGLMYVNFDGGLVVIFEGAISLEGGESSELLESIVAHPDIN